MDEEHSGGNAGFARVVDQQVRNGPLFVSSLEKGMRILNVFCAGHRDLGLNDIAELSGLDKSAAQRFTYTLAALGYLRKDTRTRKYNLSVRTLELGSAYIRSHSLVERAMPHLTATSRRCNETINFTELDGHEIVYVARIPGRNVVRVHFATGERAPAFCTATGIAILAHLPISDCGAILERATRGKRNSIPTYDPARTARLLADARRNGFAISQGEFYPGVIAIAAPVFDHSDRPVAAISISVPATGWSIGSVKKSFAELVCNAAGAISADLGGSSI